MKSLDEFYRRAEQERLERLNRQRLEEQRRFQEIERQRQFMIKDQLLYERLHSITVSTSNAAGGSVSISVPTNLTITEDGSTLSWDSNYSNFEVWVSIDSSPYYLSGTTTSKTYNLNQLVEGDSFDYKVRAYQESKYSQFTNSVNFMWSEYWTKLISATVENTSPTDVVITASSAKTSLTASDITCTVNGTVRTILSDSWTGAVWTVVLASAVIYGDVVVMTFVKTGQTKVVTNNVAMIAETIAAIAGMVVEPSSSLKKAYNKVLYRLVENSFFTRFDVFRLYGAETAQQSLRNLIKDAHHATNDTELPFTASVGYTGADEKYLNSNYNPLTEGVNFTQDSCSIGQYHTLARYYGGANTYAFGSFFTRAIGLVPYKVITSAMHVLNSTNITNTTSYIPANGLHTLVRRVSTASKFKHNTDGEFSFTSASGAIPDGNIYEGCLNNGGTAALFNIAGGYRAFFAGDEFSEAELLIIDDIIKEFIYSQSFGKTHFCEVYGTVKDTSNPILIIGDSTIGYYPQGVNCNNCSDYLQNTKTVLDLAVTGYNIAKSKTALAGVDVSLKRTIKTVFIHVGLNDCDPSIATATTIAAYQDLVNTIAAAVAVGAKIIGCTMIPFKQALSNRYPGSEAAAYQKWLDVNEAIMGGGASPITGLTLSINSHTTAMNDGDGNISAQYLDVTGPDYHENEVGRILIKNMWLTNL
jgi:hypothetical protein